MVDDLLESVLASLNPRVHGACAVEDQAEVKLFGTFPPLGRPFSLDSLGMDGWLCYLLRDDFLSVQNFSF